MIEMLEDREQYGQLFFRESKESSLVQSVVQEKKVGRALLVKGARHVPESTKSLKCLGHLSINISW